MKRRRLARSSISGQAIAEFALIFPALMLVIVGILVIGLWIFYNQQVANVAREAARYAAIHSSTAPCPTTGWRDPDPISPGSYPAKPFNCDGPDNVNDAYPWPNMTDFARKSVWGAAPTRVIVNACWSGHIPAGIDPSGFANYSKAAGFPQADNPAVVPDGSGGSTANTFVQCKIAGVDPTTSSGSLGCSSGMTTAADDPASAKPFNQVTVYACFNWTPPLAGFLLVPNTITMRAVVTEVIQRQQ